MADQGISAVLIVKDEEAVIGRCLRSLSGLDETIVLDTGSSDRTMEIAGSLGAKVFKEDCSCPPEGRAREKFGDSPRFHFARARNRAVEFSGHPWIFSIDADEILRAGGTSNMRKAVKAVEALGEAGVTGFAATFLHRAEGSDRTVPVPKTKLFRKEDWIWKYRVHERLIQKRPGAVGVLESVFVEHLPEENKSKRHGQNIELLKLCVEENPEYTRAFRHLGQELMLREKWEEAVPHLVQYVEKTDEGAFETSVAMERVGFCLGNIGRLDEALSWFERSASADPRRREPLYWAAQYLVHAGQYVTKASDKFEKAVRYLERALSIPTKDRPNSPNDCAPAWGNEPRRLLEGYRKSLEEMRIHEASISP